MEKRLQQKTDTETAATWLLTWNPKRFRDDNFQFNLAELENDVGQIGFAITKWSCGSTTSIAPGDRLFLIQLGEEPRGIVASGYALSEVFTGTHWDEERRNQGILAKRVYVKFDDIRAEKGPMLPIEILKAQFPAAHWSSQSSGIRIPKHVAEDLQSLWAEGSVHFK